MATGESRPLAHHLERLWNSGTIAGQGDAELVRRFTDSNGTGRGTGFRGTCWAGTDRWSWAYAATS